MPRIALLIEYLGKRFHGSQYQKNVRTVQSDLESALATLLRRPIKVTFSGRTDSGVHALGQVAHFDCPEDSLDLRRFNRGLNGILSDDLAIRAVQVVADDFHARLSVTERQYVYRILNSPQRSAVLKDTHYFVPHALDLDEMTQAAYLLIGRHDFAGFKSSNSDTGTTICRVTQAELLNLGEGRLEFWIAADHFVYNMVRIIAGTLIGIGLGKKSIDDMKECLEAGNRQLAGQTAPAWGLALVKVSYPAGYRLFEGYQNPVTCVKLNR